MQREGGKAHRMRKNRSVRKICGETHVYGTILLYSTNTAMYGCIYPTVHRYNIAYASTCARARVWERGQINLCNARPYTYIGRYTQMRSNIILLNGPPTGRAYRVCGVRVCVTRARRHGRPFGAHRAVRLAVHIRVLQILFGISVRRTRRLRAGTVPLRQRHPERAEARAVRSVRGLRERSTAIRLTAAGRLHSSAPDDDAAPQSS